MCAASQVVSAAGTGALVGAPAAGDLLGGSSASASALAAPVVGNLTTWVLNDGSTRYGYTFATLNEGYAIGIGADNLVTALPMSQVKTARSATAGSITINGQVAPLTLKMTWGTGMVEGAKRSGYVVAFGNAWYLWNGSSAVQSLTASQASSFRGGTP